MILISSPAIARLNLHTRKWAHERMQWGSFGPVTRVPVAGYAEGMLYAELAGVERFCGRQFDQAEIDRAVDGKPDRILIVPENKEVA
jgi:hypothetical protein